MNDSGNIEEVDSYNTGENLENQSGGYLAVVSYNNNSGLCNLLYFGTPEDVNLVKSIFMGLIPDDIEVDVIDTTLEDMLKIKPDATLINNTFKRYFYS